MEKLTEKMTFSARNKNFLSRIFAEFDRRRGAVLLINNTLLVEKPYIIFQMLHEKYSKFGRDFFETDSISGKSPYNFEYIAHSLKPLSKNPCL
jgi:hypothetical protein